MAVAAVNTAFDWGWAEVEQRTRFEPQDHSLTPPYEGSGHTTALPGSRSPLPWKPWFLSQPQTRFLLQVVRGLSAGARVFEYMALSPVIPLTGGYCIPNKDIRGSITFQNVTFRSALVVMLRMRGNQLAFN